MQPIHGETPRRVFLKKIGFLGMTLALPGALFSASMDLLNQGISDCAKKLKPVGSILETEG